MSLCPSTVRYSLKANAAKRVSVTTACSWPSHRHYAVQHLTLPLLCLSLANDPERKCQV